MLAKVTPFIYIYIYILYDECIASPVTAPAMQPITGDYFTNMDQL